MNQINMDKKSFNHIYKLTYFALGAAILFFIASCAIRSSNNVSEAIFKVCSYNIRYNSKADDNSGNGWDIRKDPLAELILKHQFDIVGTQEGDSVQMEELNDLLPGFAYIAYPYGGSAGDLHTCAILYKKDLFEIIDSGVFWLSETPGEPSVGWDATDRRICQWAKMQHKQTKKYFYFFNTHFYWRLQEAKRESGPLLIQKIKSIAGDFPVICTGDFNSIAETQQIKAIKSLLSDSYEVSENGRKGVEGTGFPGGVFQGVPGDRIDYVFVSPLISVFDYEVYSDVYNDDRYPSDHLPVACKVSI